MQSFTAGEPMERMALDIMGDLHLSKGGNKCVLVIMDYFTKYVHLLPLPDQKAATVAKALVNEVFTKVGIPRFLHSDRATNFLSELFRETCKLFKVDRTMTTPWRPQSDGMVERFNRTLGGMLRQFVNTQQDNWDELLPMCALAYNSSRHSSTSYSPNFLMFGRDFRVPLELVLPTPDEDWEENPEPYGVEHYVKRLEESMRLAYKLTRENLQASAVLQKHYYNRKAKGVKFPVGQSVWLYNPRRKIGRTPKLDMPWEGPFAVVTVIGDVVYEIQLNKRSKSKIVHVDKLRATRNPINMDWVFTLPRKKREAVPDMDLMGLPELFEKPKQQVNQPAVPEPQQGVPEEVEVVEPVQIPVDVGPALEGAEAPEPGTEGDGIMVPNQKDDLGQAVAHPGEEEQLGRAIEPRTTRSGRNY